MPDWAKDFFFNISAPQTNTYADISVKKASLEKNILDNHFLMN